MFWSEEKEKLLREAVGKHGKAWATILSQYDFGDRTNVDLKVRRPCGSVGRGAGVLEVT